MTESIRKTGSVSRRRTWCCKARYAGRHLQAGLYDVQDRSARHGDGADVKSDGEHGEGIVSVEVRCLKRDIRVPEGDGGNTYLVDVLEGVLDRVDQGPADSDPEPNVERLGQVIHWNPRPGGR